MSDQPLASVTRRNLERGWGWPDALALMFWTAAIAVFFWKVVSFEAALFYFDVTELNFSYRDFLAKEWSQGRFSRWHPGLYCGLPLWSESQAGYLHPLKWLYLILPTWKAFNLDTVLSVWLTGVFTYGWLRRHLKSAGALSGAAVFALSGFTWAHFIHTSMLNALMSVPVVIWSLESAWERGRLRSIVPGALALACQVFAGHLQDALLTSGLAATYALAWCITEPGRPGKRFIALTTALLIGLGVLLSAVQWIPSKELLDRSPRAGGLTWDQLTYGSWHPELLPTVVMREAYGTRARDTDWMDGFYPYHEMNVSLGVLALGLAALGAGASRDRWVAAWILIAAVGFVLMLGKFTMLMDYWHQIPVLGSARIPVRFHLYFAMAIAALVGFGVDRIARGETYRPRGPIALTLSLIALCAPILAWVYWPIWTDSARWSSPFHQTRFRWLGEELEWAALRVTSLVILGVLALLLGARSRSPRSRAVIASSFPILLAVDLLASHRDDVPTVPPAYWERPPASAVTLSRDPSVIRVWGLPQRSAGEPGFASQTLDFLPVRDTLAWSLAPVFGLRSAGGETPIIPLRRKMFTDWAHNVQHGFAIEGVTDVLSANRRPDWAQLSPVRIEGAAFLYKNPGALPRARLVGRPRYASNAKQAQDALRELDAACLDRLVVEDTRRPLGESAVVAGTARIVVDLPERVEIETASETPGYLVLADTFDPGWRATIDGQDQPIVPAYVTFRAVFLQAGPHRVVFQYEPAGFRAGLAWTTLGLVGLGLMLLLGGRQFHEMASAHRQLHWPPKWPVLLCCLVVVWIAVSAIRIDAGGRPGLHPRWSESVHRFTWGAGIEAMRLPAVRREGEGP